MLADAFSIKVGVVRGCGHDGSGLLLRHTHPFHHLFFTMGQDDFIAIYEAPDDETSAALWMVLGASGAISAGRTTRLLTSAESVAAMNAAKAAVSSYKPATA